MRERKSEREREKEIWETMCNRGYGGTSERGLEGQLKTNNHAVNIVQHHGQVRAANYK